MEVNSDDQRTSIDNKKEKLAKIDKEIDELVFNFHHEKRVVAKKAAREAARPKTQEEKYPSLATHFYLSGQNGARFPDHNGMADYVSNELNFISGEAADFIYTDGRYSYVSELALESLIDRLTGRRNIRPAHLSSFSKAIRARSYHTEKKLKDLAGLINLENGILNVKTGEMIPHSAEYFFKYKLPHKYDPAADCPKFKKLLKFYFDEDPEQYDLTAEIFGYCMMGGEQVFHKAFVLYGTGRNGKSTWLEILKTLLGEYNCSSVSIANLTKPFSVINLDGKLANITDETPNEQINAEAFKTATSGGHLTGAYKGRDEVQIRCDARFICSTNSIPKFSESSVGMKERLLFMKFNRFIAESDRDPFIKRAIIGGEMSGIINFALDGLRRLLARGHFPTTKAGREVMEEFKLESDSVFEWFTESVEIDQSSTRFFSSNELYSDYCDYCRSSGRRALSRVSFGKRLSSILKQELGEEIFEKMKTRGPHKTRINGYQGLVLRLNSSFL